MEKKIKSLLTKQHYVIVGNHSAVQICRWTKKAIRGEGECYKQKFYGIDSARCCQMSPSVVFCQNSCLHCWRAIENTLGIKMKKIDSPKKIISDCIKAQRKLLSGFLGYKKINKEKFELALNPNQFAISLIGEPTLYPKLNELILELRKQGKTSFLVTNGLNPEMLKKLKKKKALPTQLYLSLNSPDKKNYDFWHKSKEKNAWEKFNETLNLFPKLPTRKVIRLTLVKGENSNMKDSMIPEYAELIKKANPDFIEVKGYMAVGFARKRKGMGYDSMPSHLEIKKFSKKLVKFLSGFKILDEHKFSRVVLLGKSRKNMKIKKI